MNKKNIFILILLIAIATASCTNIDESNSISETFESIIETLATIPFETILPTIAPTHPIEEDITFTVELFNDNEDLMPYFLYTPSTRETSSETIPLIIWLQGGDEYCCQFELMSKRGLPAALANWGELEGFDAYVVCPQWTGKWQIAGWHSPNVRKNLDNVLADVLDRNFIDTEKIIIAGHSMGGRGAICNALHNVNEFEYYKVVSISGFLDDYDLQFIKDLNIRFYTGKVETGENIGIYHSNTVKLAELFGEENLFIIDGSHGNSPVVAFLLDEDGNNRSDLIEWMLE